MRASPLTEHKLVLQEFITTPAGELVLRASASQSGISADELRSMISSLPPLDFYMPGRTHRRAWRGEVQVGVAIVLDRNYGVVFTHESDGRVIGRALSSAPKEAGPRFLLHPAERKSRRISPQFIMGGQAIEDADDGQLSGSIVDYLKDGGVRVTDLADIYGLKPGFFEETGCDPETAIEPCANESVGGGGTIAGDTTYLRDFVILGVCDYWDCGQGNEFEWHTYFSADSGATWTNRRDIRLEGIPSEYAATVNIPALLRKPRTLREMIITDVVETDWQFDDHFDPSPTWIYSENGRLKTEGDLKCNPPYVNQYGDFTCGVPPLNFFWREVSQTMRW